LDDAQWLREALGLHGCEIAIRLDFLRRSASGEILFQERRYFVTSLDPNKVTVHDLLRLIRGHWQIENCLHFVKDRWWDEDRHWTIRPGLGAVFAALTNAAVSVLRLLPEVEPILRARTERIQWNPTAAVQSLGFKK
jgi:predicted transposase YbfD/YdcC